VLIAAGAHLLRVFVQGSYKAPRELTWLAGLLLLLVLFGFLFTGALLRWDQNGYWGTVIGTSIAGLVPGIGSTLPSFIRGGPDVGALTLSRFYALHTIVFPAVLLALIVAHISLVRRHGISTPPRGASYDREAFYPRYAARDAMSILVVLAILAAVAF